MGRSEADKGFFFPTDCDIPRTSIANFDAENAYLSVTKDQALHQEWSEAPVDDFSAGPAGAATGGAYAAEMASGTTEADPSGMQHRTGGTLERAETGESGRAADELSARETSANEELPPA